MLMTRLPEFKPGIETELNYTYSVATFDNDQDFTATAAGKVDTADEGRWFTVDQDNARECFPDPCVKGW